MIEIYDLEEFNVVIDDKVGAVKKKLVNYDGSFYVVSENTLLKETLIFRSDPIGKVDNYLEVGGGRGLTIEEVIADFEGHLFKW